MAQQPFVAKVIGIPHIPSIVEVNIRTGPGTNFDLAFKVPVGTANVPIIEVQQDVEKRELEGKIYQWFRCQFAQGVGWVRDDLVEVSGDGSSAGYPVLTTPVTGFSLVRQVATAVQPGQEVSATPAATTAAPVTVAAPTPPAVETPPTVQPTLPAQPAPTPGEPIAISMIEGAKLRPGPGTGNEPVLARMSYQQTAKILSSAPGDDGRDFVWVKLNFQGSEGWIREDFLRYQGDFGPIGLSAKDRYISPAPQSRWVRDFDLTGTRIGNVHWGWDHSGVNNQKGAAILAGPKGGKVIATVQCQRCGSEGASVVDKGMQVGDTRILSDAGWNFGYGHYIIVRYAHDMLPESTKAELAKRGFTGGHCFVMYAHLQDILVKQGDEVQPNQQIATLGNSGNSEGPHLHLELRASKDANQTSWAAMKNGLMTPQVLFLR